MPKLLAVVAISWALYGVVLVAQTEFFDSSLVASLGRVFVGLVTSATAWGLWRGRPWGRWLATVSVAFFAYVAVFRMTWRWDGLTPWAVWFAFILPLPTLYTVHMRHRGRLGDARVGKQEVEVS